MASLKIEPEIVIMQLERDVAVLQEDMDSLKDPDPDPCDCDCHESDVDDLRGDLRELTDIVTKLTEANAQLEGRVTDLEDTLRNVHRILNAALGFTQ